MGVPEFLELIVHMVEGFRTPAIMVADYGNNSRHGNNALVTKGPPLFSRTPPNVRVTIRVIDVGLAIQVVLNVLRGFVAICSSVKGWVRFYTFESTDTRSIVRDFFTLNVNKNG